MSGDTNLIKSLSLLVFFVLLSCSHKRDNLYDPGNSSFVPFTSPSDFTVKHATPDSVTVTWNDPNNREAGFTVYKGTDSLAKTIAASLPPGSTRWTDTGCQPFTEYYYWISTSDSLNDTVLSSKTIKIRTPYRIPLDIPENNQIPAPSGFKIMRTSKTALKLVWTADTADKRNKLIMRGFHKDSLAIYRILSHGETSFPDTMQRIENHYYSIAFFDSSSRSKRSENWISPQAHPAGLEVLPMDTAAYCKWSNLIPNTTDSIQIDRWSSIDSAWTTKIKLDSSSWHFTDHALAPYTEFRYRVSAFTNSVYSNFSNTCTLWVGASGTGAAVPARKDSNTLFLCRFDNQANDTTPELTGKCRVVMGGAQLQAGQHGQALQTNASKAAIATGRILYPDSTIVVDFWLKPQTDMSLGTDRYGILHAQPGPFRIFYYQNFLICEWKNNSGNFRSVFSNYKLKSNGWYHIVFIMENHKSSIFINDTLQVTQSGFDLPLTTQQDTLYIGKAKFNEVDIYNFKHFNGLIDEVYITRKVNSFFRSKL